jgi:hypothetical protein
MSEVMVPLKDLFKEAMKKMPSGLSLQVKNPVFCLVEEERVLKIPLELIVLHVDKSLCINI